jgi:hypothetical protein
VSSSQTGPPSGMDRVGGTRDFIFAHDYIPPRYLFYCMAV